MLLAQNGGYFTTDWYPAALVLLGLLVVSAVALPGSRRPSGPVLAAVALLTAYALWSFLSIAWSAQPGFAWDGANRTLLYAITFALLAWRPLPEGYTAVGVVLLGLAVAVIGAFEVGHLLAAAEPRGHFIAGRLSSPTGYPNADAVLWTMGAFVLAACACARTLPAPARGFLIGLAVLLGGLALMAQSRGWLFLLPAGVLLVVAVAPDPRRALAALVLVTAGVLTARASILAIHASLATGADFKAAVHTACHRLIAASVVVGLLAAVVAFVDARFDLPWRGYARSGRVVIAIGMAVALLAAATFAVASGDPAAKVRHGWDEFKGGQKHETAQSRFASGLGSNRYDFWRVGVDAFEEHPLGGLGADTFQQYYLRHRRSSEQPLYPHSVEVRALAETGLVGMLLFAGAVAAVFLAAIAGRMRWRSRAGATYAGAAVGAGAWWFVQGSLDWFWEFAGVGVLAFALLGLAAATRPPARDAAARLPGGALVLKVAGGIAALVAALSFGLPWLAEREVQDATRSWYAQPAAAYASLDRAASLNPISSRPALIKGTIAFRLNDVRRARQAFADALEREAGNPYALLELGLAEARLGETGKARDHLSAAVRADPGDRISAAALRLVRAGKRPDVAAINGEILTRARNRLK